MNKKECQICHGSTWLRDTAGHEFRCACLIEIEKNEERERIRQNSNLGGILTGFTFEKFLLRGNRSGLVRGKEFVTNYARAREPQKPLLIYGDPGSGKTHLAVAAVHYRINHNRSAMFQIAPELAARWRGLAANADEASQFMELLLNIELLVIDDFGAQYDTEFSDNQFYLLYNRRHIDQKATITTSNLTKSSLQERLRTRVAAETVNLHT